jgi:hypothetical protein
MTLLYKPDFAETAQRMTAFWRGEALDRAPVWITAPRREPISGPPAPEPPADVTQRWTDQDYLLAAAEAAMRATFYGGDAVPCFVPQLGPGSMAIHLGSAPVFAPGTVWYEPCIEDLTTGPNLAFNAEEKWWLWTKEITRRGREAGRGKFVVTFPDLIENMDILASLRGSLELLFEMKDAPEAVHRYARQLVPLYLRHYDELAGVMEVWEQGSVFVGFPGWGPGRVCKLQCDMSCMISADQFREFVQPYLREQCQCMDHSFYHLDGPDAIQHVPALMEIEELHGIQWTPGAGKEPVESETWWPMLRQVQDAGKSLFLLGVPAASIPALLRQFDKDRVLFSTWCSTQDEAEALLASL